MRIKKLISAFIFIVPAFCWAIDRTSLEVEYSKINELKKPKNVLEIRKFFIKPSCTGSNDKKKVPEWLKELVNLEELDLGTTAEVADGQDCSIVVALPDDLRSLKKLKKFVVGDSFGKKSGERLRSIKAIYYKPQSTLFQNLRGHHDKKPLCYPHFWRQLLSKKSKRSDDVMNKIMFPVSVTKLRTAVTMPYRIVFAKLLQRSKVTD